MIDVGQGNSLFRSEVNPLRKKSYLGDVLIQQPLSFFVVAVIGVMLVCLILAIAFFGTFTKKSTANGILMPEHGMLRLSSSASGVIRDVLVKEGEFVQTGQKLFVLSGERFGRNGKT
ncbi:biotin/lipoyl-binding protein, partial [Pseudomonas japonica]|uniref:biotin/lipoyl-binding protein n=1 Tax=Pseudomonas japonica TaxID=256466 RepID=UPI003A866DFF